MDYLEKLKTICHCKELIKEQVKSYFFGVAVFKEPYQFASKMIL